MKKIKIIIIILLQIFIALIEYNLYQNITNYKVEKENNKILKQEVKEYKNTESNYKQTEEKIKSVFNETDVNKLKENVKNEEQENTTLKETIFSKEEIKSNLETENNTLNNQHKVLLKKKEEEKKKNTYQIPNVIRFNQYPNYPTGCESISLYILLKYYNIDVEVDDIINNLDKGDLPYQEENIIYGGNPEIEFIGDPKTEAGYGTYELSIAKVANMYKAGIINSTGESLDNLLKIVKQNKPVIVWTSMYLAPPYISNSWIYKKTGETISWKANEHAVVLIGYTDKSVIISDPIGGTIKYQDKNTFENRYNYYGKRSLHY